MAIYHLNIKPISRSKGHSMADVLAYETGSKLISMDGSDADFTRKEGVKNHLIIGTPHKDLQSLSDAVELSETRKNSTLGRRFTIALPTELDDSQRWDAAKDYGKWLNEEYGVAVVVSVHEPDKGGDSRNHHAHITISDRRALPNGKFGEKARELTCKSKDNAIDGVIRAKHHLNLMRAKWENFANRALELSGAKEYNLISHKSYKEQGIDKKASTHLGRAKTHQLRRGEKYKPTKAIQNEVVKDHNNGLSKTKTIETPQESSRSIGEASRGGDRSTETAKETNKPAEHRVDDSESPHVIRGSKQHLAQIKARKRKDRERKLSPAIKQVTAILGSIRGELREISEKLQKTNRRMRPRLVQDKAKEKGAER